MQQLDSPRNRNVVSNVAKEVMGNRQNRATGHFRDYPLTGHADMPKSTKMTRRRREGLPKRLAVSGLHGAAPRRTTFGMTLMLRAPLWARPTHIMKLGPKGIADNFDQPVPARHDCIQPRAKRRP
jgi:hypothetical protein